MSLRFVLREEEGLQATRLGYHVATKLTQLFLTRDFAAIIYSPASAPFLFYNSKQPAKAVLA